MRSTTCVLGTGWEREDVGGEGVRSGGTGERGIGRHADDGHGSGERHARRLELVLVDRHAGHRDERNKRVTGVVGPRVVDAHRVNVPGANFRGHQSAELGDAVELRRCIGANSVVATPLLLPSDRELHPERLRADATAGSQTVR